MDDKTIALLFKLAAPYLTVRFNQEHTEIAFAFARELQEKLGGNWEVIFPAVILHDVGWSAVPEELHLKAFGPGGDPGINRVHEVEGVKIAEKILQGLSLEAAAREEILHIVGSHDSGQHPLTLEEKIVRDADKLFRFSPRGFAIDVARFRVDAGEYWHYLNGMKEKWFFTLAGKEMAARELEKVVREQKKG